MHLFGVWIISILNWWNTKSQIIHSCQIRIFNRSWPRSLVLSQLGAFLVIPPVQNSDLHPHPQVDWPDLRAKMINPTSSPFRTRAQVHPTRGPALAGHQPLQTPQTHRGLWLWNHHTDTRAKITKVDVTCFWQKEYVKDWGHIEHVWKAAVVSFWPQLVKKRPQLGEGVYVM